MWYEGLEVLWDGNDRVALRFSAGRTRQNGDRTLLVRSQRDGTADPSVIALFADFGDGSRMHVVRLPPGHRSLVLSFEAGEPGSLALTLNTSLSEGPGIDWRLVLLSLEDDALTFHGASAASLNSFLSFYEDQRAQIQRRSGPQERVLLWGTRYLQQLRPGRGRERGELTVSESKPVFPEGTYAAPIEMSVPAFRRPPGRNRGRRRVTPAPNMPAVARAIQDEERYPGHRFELRLRTSREDPTTRWLQRRSAVIHVRHQARAAAQIEAGLGVPPEHFVSLPLSNHDLCEIAGRDPEGSEDDAALRAYNLFDLLESGRDDAESVVVSRPEADGDGEPDEVELEFRDAALGDDIGIAGTQAMVLKRPASDGASSQPADIVMFNITANGLKSFDVPQAYRNELLAAAAAVQPDDRPLASVPDEQSPPVDDPRAVLAAWSARTFGSDSISFRFDAFEPIQTLSALPLIKRSADPNEIGSISGILDFYRSDPAVCTVLVGGSLAGGWWRAPAAPDMSESLLARLAATINAPGIIDAGGVRLAAESQALRIIAFDPTLRRTLTDIRIALDASTDDLRAGIEAVRSVFTDDVTLAKFAKSDIQRFKPDSIRIEDYRTRRDGGAWTRLGEAAGLANAIRDWKSRSETVDSRIDRIPTDPVSLPIVPPFSGTSQQIRDNIKKIFTEIDPNSPAKTELDNIARDFNLDEIDLPQLEKLLFKVTALAYGPEHERLIENILKTLEEWATLPDFFSEFGGAGMNVAGKAAASLRRKGVIEFVKHAQMMRKWTVPDSGQDEFTKKRVDLSKKLAERRHSSVGQTNAPDSEFQLFVIPAADQLLHHRAYQALDALVGHAQQQKGPASNDNTSSLIRKIRRGLQVWPHQAASNWTSGRELASRLNSPFYVRRLDEALRLPDFT